MGPVLVVPLTEKAITASGAAAGGSHAASSSSSAGLSFFGLGRKSSAPSSSSGGVGAAGVAAAAASYISVVPSASIAASACVDYTLPLEVACSEGVFGFSVQVLSLATNAIVTGTLSSVQTKVCPLVLSTLVFTNHYYGAGCSVVEDFGCESVRRA